MRSEGKKLKERGGKRRGIRKKKVRTKKLKKRRQYYLKSGYMRKIVKGEKTSSQSETIPSPQLLLIEVTIK